ncbi:hemoblobin-interacting domain-containing protein [Brevibacillus reuszeri]
MNFIAFRPDIFSSNKQYVITIKSTGYSDVTLTVQGPILPPM